MSSQVGMERGGGLRDVLEAKCWFGCGRRHRGRQGGWQLAPYSRWGLGEQLWREADSLVNGVVEKGGREDHLKSWRMGSTRDSVIHIVCGPAGG